MMQKEKARGRMDDDDFGAGGSAATSIRKWLMKA